MEALSEKILYEKEAMDVLDNTDAEDILWGEDLYEAKIIVYLDLYFVEIRAVA